MVVFKSDYSSSELSNRWDEYTSVSRFAGSDDTMDLIFVSKRKNNKVKLIRRAKSSVEPFSLVFRGKIRDAENGSELVGFFTKSIADYISVATILSILVYIRSIVLERSDNPNTINALIICVAIISLLFLWNYRSSKRKYADFISRITGKENDLFLTKEEKEARQENN